MVWGRNLYICIVPVRHKQLDFHLRLMLNLAGHNDSIYECAFLNHPALLITDFIHDQ